MRFADTSFWWAARQTRDRNHAAAAALTRRGLGSVVTTDDVLGETWTLARRRGSHGTALTTVDAILSLPGVEVVATNVEDRDDAWRWLRVHDEREYSYVDAVSFAVMRRLGIVEALAFDGDFAAAGFVELRP